MSRKARPWFYKQTGWWMAYWKGEKLKLAKGRSNKKAAQDKLDDLRYEARFNPSADASDHTVASIIEQYQAVPTWLGILEKTKLPGRTDGKSLGTCIEKLLKAEISRFLNIAITGSAAAGVDIPELALSTKATSDRQPQSSEPFESAYERVLGGKYDVLVCIYNGEQFLSLPGTSLQIVDSQYIKKSQMGLCRKLLR